MSRIGYGKRAGSTFAILVIVFVCASVDGTRQQAAPAARRSSGSVISLHVERFVLPNGLRVIVNEDRSTPNVSVELVSVAGTRDEKPGQHGIAHLFEHLNSGAPHVLATPANRSAYYAHTLETNAQTLMDYVRYFSMVPATALEMQLAVFADQLDSDSANLSLERLDRDRPIVINEFRRAQGRGLNDPNVQLSIRSHLFGGDHPYGHSVYGTANDVVAATVDELRVWSAAHAGAQNALLVIAGNTTVSVVRPLVERYFGSVAPGPSRGSSEKWIPRSLGQLTDTFYLDVTQPIVSKSWVLPEWGSPDNDQLRLLAEILADGPGSRLYQRLVVREHLAQAVASEFTEWQLAGKLTITATLNAGASSDQVNHAIEDVNHAIDEEVAALLKSGPTSEEVARTKGTMLAHAVRSLQDVGFESDRLQLLVEGELFRHDPWFYKVRLERTAAGTSAKLLEAGRRWLNNCHLAVALPVPKYSIAGVKPDRAVLPIAPVIPPTFPTITHVKLADGINAIVIEKHTLPLIELRFLFPVADEQRAEAALATGLLSKGTRTRSAGKIDDLLRKSGIKLSTELDRDFAVIALSTLSGRFDESAKLVADLLADPVFPETEFNRRKSSLASRIENDRSSALQERWRVLPSALFGKQNGRLMPLSDLGQYAVQLAPSVNPDQLKTVTRDMVVSYHRNCITPNRTLVIVTGDITAASVKARLDRYLSSWQSRGGCTPHKTRTPATAGPSVYEIDQPGASQSYLLAAQPVPELTADDVFGYQAATALLSIRLNDNLRTKHGWSYGAEAVISRSCSYPFLYVDAAVQPDKTAAAIQEIVTEFRRAVDDSEIPDDEIIRLKRSLMRPISLGAQTVESTALAGTELIRFNLPLDYYQSTATRIPALSSDAVKRAARNMLRQQERLVWIVVGDVQVTRPQIEHLNLGPMSLVGQSDVP